MPPPSVAGRLPAQSAGRLPTRFSLLHSGLNDFLFAAVGDEQIGMPVDVMSALTRLGIDPRAQAAPLAASPSERATTPSIATANGASG